MCMVSYMYNLQMISGFCISLIELSTPLAISDMPQLPQAYIYTAKKPTTHNYGINLLSS